MSCPAKAGGTPRRRRLVPGALWGALLLQSTSGCRTEPIPVWGELPPFRLLDQNGRAYGTQELRGRVWVAGFFFSRCPSVCPGLHRAMARLSDSARARGLELTLVSITVDPAHDTPEVLSGYAHRFAGQRPWKFLTGPPRDLRQVIEGGFRVAMAEGPFDSRPDAVVHASRVLLVDPKLRLRGAFDARKPSECRALMEAAREVQDGED